MPVLNKNEKKIFCYYLFRIRGKIAILTGLLGQSKVGGVIFKIFITRWQLDYIKLGNNTISILTF